MKTLKDYPITELKLIYNLLHIQLPIHTELMDSEFLPDLQHQLLLQASSEGVDVSLHADWASWLGKRV